MSASIYTSSNELFPFPLSPPSLDFSRRRRAPSALKLGAAYQKRIPRTFRKFHSPVHPNDLSADSHCLEEVKTGRLIINYSKIGTVKRYTPETIDSPSQKDSKKEFQIKRGDQLVYGSCATSPPTKSSTSSSSPSKSSDDDSAAVYDGMSEGEKAERRMIYKQINALLEAS